jgi:hypothetical protein
MAVLAPSLAQRVQRARFFQQAGQNATVTTFVGSLTVGRRTETGYDAA